MSSSVETDHNQAASGLIPAALGAPPPPKEGAHGRLASVGAPSALSAPTASCPASVLPACPRLASNGHRAIEVECHVGKRNGGGRSHGGVSAALGVPRPPPTHKKC